MAAAKASSDKWPEHAGPCMKMKALFGLLVLLVGLYGIVGDMGILGAKASLVSPWWILVVLAGLMCLLKASAGSKCPACKMR